MCLEQNKPCLVTSSPDGTLGVIAVILHYCNILDKAQWFIPSPQCLWRLFPSRWKCSWPCCSWPLGPLWAPVGARAGSTKHPSTSGSTRPCHRPGLHSALCPEKWLHFLLWDGSFGTSFLFSALAASSLLPFSNPACFAFSMGPPRPCNWTPVTLWAGKWPCSTPCLQNGLKYRVCTILTEPKDYQNTTERYCFPPLLLLCRLKPSVQWIMCWLTPKNPSWIGATCAGRA